jgi:hypothetical protein
MLSFFLLLCSSASSFCHLTKLALVYREYVNNLILVTEAVSTLFIAMKTYESVILINDKCKNN